MKQNKEDFVKYKFTKSFKFPEKYPKIGEIVQIFFYNSLTLGWPDTPIEGEGTIIEARVVSREVDLQYKNDKKIMYLWKNKDSCYWIEVARHQDPKRAAQSFRLHTDENGDWAAVCAHPQKKDINIVVPCELIIIK